MPLPGNDTIEELFGPVCTIADLRPEAEWPVELRKLIVDAQKVKQLYGFHVETISTSEYPNSPREAERDWEDGATEELRMRTDIQAVSKPALGSKSTLPPDLGSKRERVKLPRRFPNPLTPNPTEGP